MPEPKQTSVAAQLTNWEKLVTNVNANREELPDLQIFHSPLEELLEDAKALNARVQSRRGVKQQEGKDLRELMRTGRFRAAQLRAGLKAFYGYQSERLLEYGIKPIRTRKRPPVEPEEPEQPSPGPEVEAALETAKAPKPEDPAPAPEVKPASQKS